MDKINLSGTWEFKAVGGDRTFPSQRRSGRSWMKASVPGTIHTDLMKNGIIPDPFKGMNENQVQWVDSQKWSYRKEFMVGREFIRHSSIDLVAEGLDTFATVRVNGKIVGRTSNMLVGHRIGVRKYLKEGKNVIEILFDSPVLRAKTLERRHGKLEVALESHRVYVRKAQYSFGWDWGPKLTTSGIWKHMYLQGYTTERIEHAFIQTVSLSQEEAVIRISVSLQRRRKTPLSLEAMIIGNGARVVSRMTVKSNDPSMTMRIPKPLLWWPNGYGAQPLYSASVSIRENDATIDSLSMKFGIRSVRLLHGNAGRESFVFEVNGKKIYCKGVNWIPADTFLPRIRKDRYVQLLTMARDAHMNMVRVWGGGIYEADVFYEMCDELGLMVWQDFMFACGEYPQTRWFLRQVEEESRKVLLRLRNHPSIVLWCGNNECEWIYCSKDPSRKPDDMTGAVIFGDILRRACRELDGSRPYWRSSPFGKGFPNDESSGNHHQWMVWSAWKDHSEYTQTAPGFVTEFGFQGPANVKTLNKVLGPSDRTPQSPAMEHHNKQVEGMERIFRFLAGHYQVPTDYEEFIAKGQILQAEALKTGVEHWRRRKFKTAGSIIWQLNDCWPVISWSLIDSAGRPKAAYFYARRFFAPVLVSFSEGAEGRIEVWITNDTLMDQRGILSLSAKSFTGAETWKSEQRVTVRANSSKRCFSVRGTMFPSVPPFENYLYGSFNVTGKPISENRFFFSSPKHWNVPVPSISAVLKAVRPGEYVLRLKADRFAKDVSVAPAKGEFRLSDNYVDLDPRIPREIIVTTSLPIRQVSKGLLIASMGKEVQLRR